MQRKLKWLILIFGWGSFCFGQEMIERYLNSLSSIKAEFEQINDDGTLDSGKLVISKPGKMRIDYNEPNHTMILVRDDSMLHYDRDLETESYYPIKSTPLYLILKKDLSLKSEGVQIKEVKKTNNIREITLSNAKEEGEITLYFTENGKDLTLVQWKVIDKQGFVTVVRLSNIRENEKVDNKEFRFVAKRKSKERE